MNGTPNPQTSMLSYISLEDRVPVGHPLRRLRVLVDSVLATMDEEFSVVNARRRRPSIPPERLLKVSLLQSLYSIRSERILVKHIGYNLLYRWFVGLSIDELVWDHSTFSHNRDRLFIGGLGRVFFERVRMLAERGKLTSDEHFNVDGTLIEEWASRKSFRPKDGCGDDRPGGPSARRRWR